MSEKSCLSCDHCVWDAVAVEYRCDVPRPEFPDACPLHSENEKNGEANKNAE